MTIRAIVFDVGGVLCNCGGISGQARNLERYWGLEEGTIAQLWLDSTLLDKLEKNEISIQDFAEETRKLASVKFGTRNIDPHAYLFSMEEHMDCRPEYIQAIQQLRRANFKCAGMANTFPGAYGENERIFREQLFDVFLTSHEVKVLKPHPVFFSVLLKRLDCHPEEVIVLDDDIEVCKAVEECGMTSILVDANTPLWALNQLSSLVGMPLLPSQPSLVRSREELVQVCME